MFSWVVSDLIGPAICYIVRPVVYMDDFVSNKVCELLKLLSKVDPIYRERSL